MTGSNIKATALSAALFGTLAAPVGVHAQNYETGGVQLTFGMTLRLEAQDNRALNVTSAGNSLEAANILSFGLLTETRFSRFALDIGGTLRALDTPTSVPNANGFVTPSIALEYSQNTASSRLSFSASLRESDLSDGDVVDLGDGTLITTGGVTQRRSTLEAKLDMGDDRSFGWGVFARLEDTDFRDGTATTVGGTPLNDSQRLTFGLSGRFDLTKAATLTSELTWQRFEQDLAADERITVSLDNTLTIDRPLGPLTFGLNITDTEEGTRTNLSVGRTYEMPLGVISGTLGLARASSGDTFLTSTLDYNRALSKTSMMSFGFSRDVASSEVLDSERVNTRFDLGYTQELSPLANLRLGLDWAESEETFSGAQTTSTTVSATYSRELTEDWNMDVGYRHRVRDDSALGKANSNTVFLELRRAWVSKY